MFRRFRKVLFGTVHNGQKAHLFIIKRKEISFCVTDFGCTITSLKIRDEKDSWTDVVLGMETLAGYASNWGSFGAVIGRYSNRINGASFELKDKKISLSENIEGACLHGGFPAWGNIIWNAKKVCKKNACGVCFWKEFKDGEQGFPGNLKVQVEYLIDDNKQLSMVFRATTDEETPISITNHSYFNLRGKDNVKDYELQLFADRYIDLESSEKIKSVAGTDFDFTKKRRWWSESMLQANPDFKGYDICYAATGYCGSKGIPLEGTPMVKIAEISDPISGRGMSVSSNQEGFQLYTGNYVRFTPGKEGRWYQQNEGICIETQSFPDSPNQESFPSVVLQPGEQYEARTVYAFYNDMKNR